ncbi:zinc finger MYM-type protein 5-like [Stegodyphus dumicola]|uniref:zinc finger MYM-type protein 5-like n=1 Tax=Stegodyphus dumicola TaxID=202533 RepID=UPI0015AD74EE|nr:zinc finger MYM-type protein 5-like [Stegodyphus dumicola]
MKTKKKSQNRKRNAEKDAALQKQADAMSQFIKKMKTSSGVNDAHTESASESITKEQTSSSQRTSAALDEVIERTDETPKKEKDDPSMVLNKSEVRDYPGNSMEETGINENSFLYIDFDDPAKWPTLSDKVRMSELGPIQRKGLMYPKSNNGGKFSDTYYNRKMENGELVPRTWLLYSISTNSVFLLLLQDICIG